MIGGVNTEIFSRDETAVKQKIARLKPLIAMGGYLPMPNQVIGPDADWNLIARYTSQLKKVFS